MATPLPSASYVGTVNEVLAAVVDDEIAVRGWRAATLTFTCNYKGLLVWEGEIHSPPPTVAVSINADGTIATEDAPLKLLANDPGLNVENIQWNAELRVQGVKVYSWWLPVAEDGETVNLADVVPAAKAEATQILRGPRGYPVDDVQRDGDTLVFGVQGNDVGTVDISDLTFHGSIDEVLDAGEVGKVVVRAEDEAAARTAIGGTEVGQAVFTAETEEAAREAIGAQAEVYQPSGAVADGTADDRAALAAADINALSSGEPILLSKGTYRVSSNLTITSPVQLQPGAVIKPDNGVTVTLAGGVTAPLAQVFDHSAGGVVVPKRADFYHPQWWGPTGTADDSQAWQDMAESVAASGVTSGEYFGQQIQAPTGLNRIVGVELANCTIHADYTTHCFVPPDGTTSGTVLTLGNWGRITGGYFRTTEAGQAVTLLWQKGHRAQADNVYVENNAENSVGVIAGWTGQSSSTPVINNLRIRTANTTPAAGSIGLDVQSADSEFTNIWVARCDIGIKGTLAGAGRWTNVHVWENNTGITGLNFDAMQVTNLYLDSNRGWGLDVDAMERASWTNIYAWNNGHSIAGTGGIRLRRTGSYSARRSIFRGVFLNDNVGHGILVDGVTDYEVEAILSSTVMQGGGSAVTTTGVEVTSGTSGLILSLRGTGATIPLTNSSTSTVQLANLDTWAAKTAPSGTVADLTTAQTFQNKVLENTCTARLKDSQFILLDAGDTTKRAFLNVPPGQTTATDVTHTLPPVSSTLSYRLTNTATLDFGSVAAQSHADLTIAVTGAVSADSVALGVSASAITAGIAYTAWVSAADTVTVRAHNYTAGAIDPPSGSFRVTVVR